MSNKILHIFICSNIFKWLLCQRTHQDFTWIRTLIKLPFGHKMASVINLKKIIFLCQATSLFCSKLKWKYFFGQTCRSGLFSLIFVIPRLPEDLWLSRRPWPETARLSSEYGPQVWITILSLSLSLSLCLPPPPPSFQTKPSDDDQFWENNFVLLQSLGHFFSTTEDDHH